MKKLIILSIAFLFSITAKTQEYIPFDFEKGVWVNSQPIELGSSTIQYYCKDDTLIDDIKYYKLFGYTCTVPIFGTPTSYPFYYGGIRNNEKKQVILNDGNLRILYDFNLKVGDTIINGLSGKENNPIVKRIDSVLICGVYHKRYITQYHKLGGDSVALIEGIGTTWCLLGLRNIKYAAGEFGSVGCYTEVGNSSCTECRLLVKVNNNLDISENNNIFPNPSNAILTIVSIKEIRNLTITDLSGRNYYSKSLIHKNNVEISTKQFNSGYYLLHIQFQDNTFISKPFIIN